MNIRPTQPETLSTILGSLRSGESTYLDELEARFAEIEPTVRAFLLEAERFERLRREFDGLLSRYPDPEDRPPLFGLPVGVKDIFHADGFETRAGSQLPPEALAGREATSLTMLKTAGALVLGKTVTTEFAYFSPGPTRNPWNPDHTPGGSSSGSAAAVAAGLTAMAFGTQTIGSINRPAAFCGVIGFKPSFDRISTDGVIPLSPSLDHVGFFTGDIASAQAIASVLVPDWHHARIGEKPVLGVPTGPFLEQTSEAGMENLSSALDWLRRAGFSVIEVPAMSDYDQVAERHRLILAAEASVVHAGWFEEHKALYMSKTAELIRTGKQIPAEALEEALEGRERLRDELQAAMERQGVDLWLSPSALGTAPKGLESTGDPAMNLPWTHAGIPTLTLPSGIGKAGLPYGVQITAAWGADEFLLAHAASIESVLLEGAQSG
jgi:Asp-tRNA(Asn)/Glu-tRNA(Gln) amidotransferase A subunit family amidase